MMEAVIIRDSKNQLKDMGSVLQIARSLGKEVFRTYRKIRVIRILGPFPEIPGYIALLEGPGSPSVQRPVTKLEEKQI